MYGTVSPIARIHRFRNQRRVASLAITPSNPLAIVLLSVPAILYFACLEVLVPKGGMFPPGASMILLNWKLRLPPASIGLLMALQQQAKKGVL